MGNDLKNSFGHTPPTSTRLVHTAHHTFCVNLATEKIPEKRNVIKHLQSRRADCAGAGTPDTAAPCHTNATAANPPAEQGLVACHVLMMMLVGKLVGRLVGRLVDRLVNPGRVVLQSAVRGEGGVMAAVVRSPGAMRCTGG